MKEAYENYLAMKAKHPGNTVVDIDSKQAAVDRLVIAVGLELNKPVIRPVITPVSAVLR